jgi:hypothetical protein
VSNSRSLVLEPVSVPVRKKRREESCSERKGMGKELEQEEQEEGDCTIEGEDVKSRMH